MTKKCLLPSEMSVSLITDHVSPTNKVIMEKLKCCKNYRNVTQRHGVSKSFWKNGAKMLA